jgi:outer membrane protein TolC
VATSQRSSAAEGWPARSAPGLLQPVFQAGRLRRNLEVFQARYTAAVAEYQKAALNGYREVANSLVSIQKLAEIRVQRQLGVTHYWTRPSCRGPAMTRVLPATSRF